MSDWVIDDSQEAPKSQEISNQNDWEIVPNDSPQSSNEGLGYSSLMALPRIGSDIYESLYKGVQNLPQRYSQAKTEIPGLGKLIAQHPEKALSQSLAGLAELGQNVFNMPHDIINYAANRLNLFPKDINQMIQMARMPESSKEISKTFGDPAIPGEALLRGTLRNALNLAGTGKVLSTLNTMRPKVMLRNKLNTIKNEYKSNKALEKASFDKIMNPHGSYRVTSDPSNYLSQIGIEKKKLFPDARDIYDKFMNDPNIQHLHDLQSQIARDETRTKTIRPNKSQLFGKYKRSILKDIQNNLSNISQDALNDYNVARDITKNLVKPYEANPTLKQVSQGTYKDITSKKLHESISRGTRKPVYQKGDDVITAIPEGHALRNHLNDLNKIISRENKLLKLAPTPGRIVTKIIPAIAGEEYLRRNVFKD